MKLEDLDILDVWRALGGWPLRGRRGKAFWRDGDGWNVALNRELGTWFDYRDHRGGRSLSLVKAALGCDRRTALQWLEANCGLDPTRPLSAAERRLYRQDRKDAEHFGIAAQSLAEDLLDRLDACDPDRVSYTRLLSTIRTGGNALMDEYRAWRDRHPELTTAMVRASASSNARLQRRLALYLMELENVA